MKGEGIIQCFRHCHLRIENGFRRKISHLLHDFLPFLPGIHSQYSALSFRGLYQTKHCPDGSALSSSIGADISKPLPFFYLKVQAFNATVLPVSLYKAFQ